MTKREANLIETIAEEYIYTVKERGGLEEKGTDAEDFFEVSVWSLREALEAVYEAGKNSR